jgi:hypothetical protein
LPTAPDNSHADLRSLPTPLPAGVQSSPRLLLKLFAWCPRCAPAGGEPRPADRRAGAGGACSDWPHRAESDVVRGCEGRPPQVSGVGSAWLLVLVRCWWRLVLRSAALLGSRCFHYATIVQRACSHSASFACCRQVPAKVAVEHWRGPRVALALFVSKCGKR